MTGLKQQDVVFQILLQKGWVFHTNSKIEAASESEVGMFVS